MPPPSFAKVLTNPHTADLPEHGCARASFFEEFHTLNRDHKYASPFSHLLISVFRVDNLVSRLKGTGSLRITLVFQNNVSFSSWLSSLALWSINTRDSYEQYHETHPADKLIADSGKLKALDTLLLRLKSEGHRCLVYSQMTRGEGGGGGEKRRKFRWKIFAVKY